MRGLLLASALAAPASGAMVQQVDEVVDRAQAEVYEITQRTTAEDYAPLSEAVALLVREKLTGAAPPKSGSSKAAIIAAWRKNLPVAENRER